MICGKSSLKNCNGDNIWLQLNYCYAIFYCEPFCQPFKSIVRPFMASNKKRKREKASKIQRTQTAHFFAFTLIKIIIHEIYVYRALPARFYHRQAASLACLPVCSLCYINDSVETEKSPLLLLSIVKDISIQHTHTHTHCTMNDWVYELKSIRNYSRSNHTVSR